MEGKSVEMVEYAWDVSPGNNLKCDPCVAAAPTREVMVQPGVWWLGDRQDPDDVSPDRVYPATGDLSCPEGKKYLDQLKERRRDELEMLTYLTGKGITDWDLTRTEGEKNLPREDSYAALGLTVKKGREYAGTYLFIGVAALLISLVYSRQRPANDPQNAR
jgi:hypothetical protein